MTKHQTPSDKDAALTAALSEFKAAAFTQAPRPSAELLARLDLQGASKIASTTPTSDSIQAIVTANADTVSSKKRIRQVLSWVTGLGVFAKIILASSVASAAVLGAGAAGVLPGGVQEAFDTVVSTVTEDPESVPTPAPSASFDNFGGYVSDLAHDLGKDGDGRAFGDTISDAAKDKDHGNNGNNPAEHESDEDSTQDDEPGSHAPAGGKPAEKPGGKKG